MCVYVSSTHDGNSIQIRAIIIYFKFNYFKSKHIRTSHANYFQLNIIVKVVHPISAHFANNDEFFSFVYQLPYNHTYLLFQKKAFAAAAFAVQCSRLKYESQKSEKETNVTYPVLSKRREKITARCNNSAGTGRTKSDRCVCWVDRSRKYVRASRRARANQRMWEYVIEWVREVKKDSMPNNERNLECAGIRSHLCGSECVQVYVCMIQYGSTVG